jgi:hypothetical protein
MRESKSILDSVSDKLADLTRALGPQDRVKIHAYTDAVRDVERRIQLAEQQSDAGAPLVEEPLGIPSVFEDHLQLMFDLQLLALQAGLTRVITFMIGREQSTRAYPQIGVSEAHHPLSHHENQPDRLALMSKINAYHTTLVAGYLAKLRATPDGDGSLLDHMTIMNGTCLSNSTRHAGDNVPILVIGGGAGRLRGGGRHLKYPGNTSHATLLLTLMDKFDMPLDKLGDTSERLPIDTLSGL